MGVGSLAVERLLLDGPAELGESEELESSEELGAADEPEVADDVGSAELGESDELGSSDGLGTLDESPVADEMGSAGASDTSEVVVEVDKRSGKSGRSAVTAAVANAVVLPNASTAAVTSTTTSALEFVLSKSEMAAVPWRLSSSSLSSAEETDLWRISRCTSSTRYGDGCESAVRGGDAASMCSTPWKSFVVSGCCKASCAEPASLLRLLGGAIVSSIR